MPFFKRNHPSVLCFRVMTQPTPTVRGLPRPAAPRERRARPAPISPAPLLPGGSLPGWLACQWPQAQAWRFGLWPLVGADNSRHRPGGRATQGESLSHKVSQREPSPGVLPSHAVAAFPEFWEESLLWYQLSSQSPRMLTQTKSQYV